MRGWIYSARAKTGDFDGINSQVIKPPEIGAYKIIISPYLFFTNIFCFSSCFRNGLRNGVWDGIYVRLGRMSLVEDSTAFWATTQ